MSNDDGADEGEEMLDKINKMWNLYMGVRVDPIKYIGEPDIYRLEAFYSGLDLYFERSEGMLCYRIEGFREFLVDGKCTNPGNALGPADVVRFNCKDSEEAFYRFYEFLEEFLSIQGELYEPLCLIKPCKPLPIIEGGAEKVIWGLVNTEWTKIPAGGISLRLLESYISGVIHCALTLEDKCFELLPGFDEYLGERFSAEDEMNRYQIIQENSADDKEAFRNYYAWMQEFLRGKGPEYQPVVESGNL